MAQFKIGDTVRLKSGGPLMTITGVGNDSGKGEVIWTSWFVDDEEKTGYYPAAAVQADDDGRTRSSQLTRPA